MTSLPYETDLGELHGDRYIAVQLVLRRGPAGDTYYCPLSTWLSTTAAQLIERDQQIAQLRHLVDQALAERDSVQTQLQQQVAEAQAQLQEAAGQVAQLQQQVVEAQAQHGQAAGQVAQLQQLLDQALAERDNAQAGVQRAITNAEQHLVEHYERELAALREQVAPQHPSTAEAAEAVEDTAEIDRPRAERVECPECHKKYWPKQLAEHRYYQHDVPMEQPPAELPPVPPPAGVACLDCGAQLLDEDLLAKHQRTECGRTRRPQQRQRTVELVSNTPWACTSCQSAAFTRSLTRPDLCMRCAAAPVPAQIAA